jgi:hypothetical protein
MIKSAQGIDFTPIELGSSRGEKVIRTFCLRACELPDPDPRVKCYVPSNFDATHCESTEGAELLGIASGAMLPFVCRQCVHNELNAIRNRMIFVHECDDNAWADARLARDWLHENVLPSGDVDVDIERWLTHGTAAWERRLRKIHESDFVLGKQDFGSKLFVKWEIVLKCPFWGPPLGKSRIIMAKTDVFLYCTGPWIHARGLLVKAHLSTDSPFCYAAGHTPQEIGQWCFDQESRLIGLWGKVGYLDIDCTNYDGSQRLAALEHNRYQRSRFNPPALLELCMASFKRFKARSFGGVVVSGLCVRNTGGADTSDGNSENGLDTWLGWLLTRFPEHDPRDLCAMVFMGDDNFMIVAPFVLQLAIREVEQYYLVRGLNAKVNFRTHLSGAEFCSMLFLPHRNSYVLSPKPGRVLSKAFWRLKTSSTTPHQTWLSAVSAGLQHDCSHVPVLHGFVRWASRWLRPDQVAWQKHLDEDRDAAYQFRNKTQLELSEEAWPWLAIRYGVGIDDLRALDYALETQPPGAALLSHWLLTRISGVDNCPKTTVDHEVAATLWDPVKHGREVRSCDWYADYVYEERRDY